MKKFLLFLNLLMLCVVTTTFVACGDNDDDDVASSGIDTRFVGTWVRDESVTNVVERGYTIVLNGNGSASYSFYSYPKSSSLKDTNYSSKGTWRYDATSNRIITDCTMSELGTTLILDVINVTSTTLVVKQEGSSTSRTYNRLGYN